MAEHQVMSWLSKHHSYKRDLVSHPNDRVDGAASGSEGNRMNFASRPPVKRLVRLRLGGQTCGTLGKGAYHQFPV
jgi:hypothetical protein